MLQFRLRTLFIMTTIVAVLAWAFYAPPQWLGLLAIYLVYSLLPAAIVAGIIYHRGDWQAFFIGMAPWIVVFSIGMAAQTPWISFPWPFGPDRFSADPDEVVYEKLILAVPLGIAVASGLAAVGIRWWAAGLGRRTD